MSNFWLTGENIPVRGPFSSYTKGLKNKVLTERKTDLFYNELITGIDGKERYFKGIRIQMYDEIIKEIKKYGNFDIYLGMEEEYIWKKVLK